MVNQKLIDPSPFVVYANMAWLVSSSF